MVEGDTLLESKFWHTIKTFNSNMAHNETEREIEIDEFGLLYKKANRFIVKNRHIKKHDSDDLKWEIDDMGRKLKLIIAEIEIPSEDYDLKIPEWLEPYVILEITGMKQFSNSNLAN
jgi:CYTH domain-containing protein